MPTRIGFRFIFSWLLLVILPFPFDDIPGLGWVSWLIGRALDKPFAWTTQLAAWLVHYTGPLTAEENGSGDRSVDWLHQLGLLMLAAVITATWCAIQRRSTRHDRLYGFLRGYARYWLSWVLFSYGLSKVFLLQMPEPWGARLEEKIGDASPMGLLWTLIGSSTFYERFTGLAELTGAVLLLWSRTALLGALVLVGVMTNVVMYNLCYDVPVKIFSSTLLLTALFLCMKDAPRLLAVLRGDAVAAVPRWSPPSRRLRNAVIALEVVAALGLIAQESWSTRESIAQRPPKPTVVLPFEGDWRVEKQVVDGREVPGLLTEDKRWQWVTLTHYSMGVGLQAHHVDQTKEGWWGQLDEGAHTLQFSDQDSKKLPVMTYTFPDADHMVLSDASQKLSLTLRKLPPHTYLLTTRGFRWVSEEPFNR